MQNKYNDVMGMFRQWNQPKPTQMPFAPILDRSAVRHDGQALKGTGWLGTLTNSKGQDVTEYALTGSIGGHEMDYPSVVPTLNTQELEGLLKASAGEGKIPTSVLEKARAHAEMRVKQGLPVWKDSNTYYGSGR